MTAIVLQMAALIFCGLFWRIIKPGGLEAEATRQAVSGVVYYLLLPALVLDVLAKTPLGVDTARIATLGMASILFMTGVGWLAYRWTPLARPRVGAALLALAFPNVTFLGLPVLKETFGDWARAVAIQIDLFATLPLVLTLAVSIARRHGADDGRRDSVLMGMARVPALWAALLTTVLGGLGLALPHWLARLAELLGGAAAPLMLLSLGLSLRLDVLKGRHLLAIVPVVLLKLLVMPLLAWHVAPLLGFTGETLRAVVLETAMPSMVVGIVLCDRFRLDGSLYALAVTVTTLLSMETLPLWYRWMGGS